MKKAARIYISYSTKNPESRLAELQTLATKPSASMAAKKMVSVNGVTTEFILSADGEYYNGKKGLTKFLIEIRKSQGKVPFTDMKEIYRKWNKNVGLSVDEEKVVDKWRKGERNLKIEIR